MQSLAALTTLRVGGPARSLRTATSADELVEAVTALDGADEPLLLVAGGSNLLVADEGFDGTVVRVATSGIHVERADPGFVQVRIAAGEPWDVFVTSALAQGWSGLEALSGIPGSTGATPIQNVGAYGAEVSQVIESLDVLDRTRAEVVSMPARAAGFSYRGSALKRDPGRWVVLAVTMRLAVDAMSAPIGYGELAGRLGVGIGERAPAGEVRQAVLALRRGKGMVLDEGDHDTWSAGSFFTNPILSAAQAEQLPAGAPRFAQPDGSVKTSAAWLISHAGFDKGFALAPGAAASLSTKHVLALTNRGGARAQDLLDLARAVRAGVRDHFGIVLENEPVLVGCAL